MRNFSLELKDTSEAEMQKFDRFMLQVLTQVSEEKKAAREFDKLASKIYGNETLIVPVAVILRVLKGLEKKRYEDLNLSKLINWNGYRSIESKGVFKYLNNQGTEKNGVIELWYDNNFIGLNLDTSAIKADVEFEKNHNQFYLAIYDTYVVKPQMVFKFTVDNFDLFKFLLKELGLNYTESYVKDIKAKYKLHFKEANLDPDKLDTLYESLPQIVWDDLTDKQLYIHLDLILDSLNFKSKYPSLEKAFYNIHSYLFGGMGNTREEKAILNILYAIKNRDELYKKFNDTDIGLLLRIYDKLNVDDCDDLMRFLYKLVKEFDSSKPTDTVYFDNTYYLFRDTHLKTELKGNYIVLNNYKDNYVTTYSHDLRPTYQQLKNETFDFSKTRYSPINYISNKPFKPLAKLNFGTKLADDELLGDEYTFALAIKLHNKVFRQSNWDYFDIATDLLSLLSAAGMVRIIAARGVALTTKVVAGGVLAKDAIHYAMLSQNTLQKWHANGYGWLANIWLGISIGTDLLSFSLPDLRRIAREGKAAADLADTAEEASSIRKTIESVKAALKEKYSEFLEIKFQINKKGQKILEDLKITINEKIDKINNAIDTLFLPPNYSPRLVTVGGDFEVLEEGKSVFEGTLEAVKKYIDKFAKRKGVKGFFKNNERRFFEEDEIVIIRKDVIDRRTRQILGNHYQLIYYNKDKGKDFFIHLVGGEGEIVSIGRGENKINLFDIPVADRKIIPIKGKLKNAFDDFTNFVDKEYTGGTYDCFKLLESAIKKIDQTITFKPVNDPKKFSAVNLENFNNLPTRK
ncbi:MAG: hypothetical protein QM535_03395 [Limnohabitans sp.]|nr:hypothetical protein [Limnohabitans sp.]